MMNRTRLIIEFIFLSILAGCSQFNEVQPINGSTDSTKTSIAISVEETVSALYKDTPTPVQYTSSQNTSQPTNTTIPSVTASPEKTPKPYLISYDRSGGDGEGSGELYSCLYWLAPYKRFILYADGQLIMYKSGKVLETHLTETEIGLFLQEIESTGFLEIQESRDSPDGYDIYNLPEDYQYGDGGPGSRIIVQDMGIHVRDSLWDYLISPIKNTISIINEYEPIGDVEPYIPDSLEMIVLSIEDAESLGCTLPDPREWPSELFPLEYMYEYFNEKESDEILRTNIFTSFPNISIFTYEGLDYFVLTCPNRLDR